MAKPTDDQIRRAAASDVAPAVIMAEDAAREAMAKLASGEEPLTDEQRRRIAEAMRGYCQACGREAETQLCFGMRRCLGCREEAGAKSLEPPPERAGRMVLRGPPASLDDEQPLGGHVARND